jgi:hypothetical protein
MCGARPPLPNLSSWCGAQSQEQLYFTIHNTEQMRKKHRVLFCEPECKKSLSKPGRRWEDNIKMNFKGIWYVDVDCIILS